MARNICAPQAHSAAFGEVDERANRVHTLAGLLDHQSSGHIGAQLAAGRWQRPHRAVVVTHNGPLTRDQRIRAALAGGPPGSAVAGLSALELDGLRGFSDDAIYLSVPKGNQRIRRSGVVTHWSSFLGPRDVHPAHDPRRTRIPRSVLDAAAWNAHDRMARAVVLACVQQRLTTTALLRAVLPTRRPCLRRALIAESIGDAEGGVSSVPERDFNDVVVRRGFPPPTCQAVRRGPDGRCYLDAEWEEFDTAVEVHGMQHLTILAWDADLNRANDIVVHGPRLLQFTSYAVRRHPARVGDLLERAPTARRLARMTLATAPGVRAGDAPGIGDTRACGRRFGRNSTDRYPRTHCSTQQPSCHGNTVAVPVQRRWVLACVTTN